MLSKFAGLFVLFGMIVLLCPMHAYSEEVHSVQLPGFLTPNKNAYFKASARGFASYSKFQTFENLATTTPYWKGTADLNEIELKGEYHPSDRTELEFEIEFEHGGTGSTVEYDAFDESGDFEAEQEKGGEVYLSEFYYKHRFNNQMWIKAGKIPVYMSLGSVQENLLLFPSVLSSSAELYMLPEDWRELGVELQKKWGEWNGRIDIINGLNSEFFRKYNWIGGGYQTRFESANANALAAHASFQYGELVHGNGIGAAIYYGDTAANRYKRSKVTVDANLLLWSVMGSWRWQRIGVRGEWIEGTLQSSDKVSEANGTLGNLANPGAFSAIGHKASLQMLELSYRLLSEDERDLDVFASYQHVNTMQEVQGTVSKDDRYNQMFISGGLAYRFENVMFLKAEYTKASNALTGIPATDEYQLAFGFDLEGPRSKE